MTKLTKQKNNFKILSYSIQAKNKKQKNTGFSTTLNNNIIIILGNQPKKKKKKKTQKRAQSGKGRGENTHKTLCFVLIL